MRSLTILLAIIIVACALIYVTTGKADGDGLRPQAIFPLAADAWLYGSAQTADGVNVANVTVSMGARTGTTNISGSWKYG